MGTKSSYIANSLVGFGVLLLTSNCGSDAQGSEEPVVATAAQALTGDGTPIAVENQSTTAYGNVAYGANDSFFFRPIRGAFTCDNATFGDPLIGTGKACYMAGTLPAPPMATIYLGNSPSGSYNWSEDLQGIAHDDGHWFITEAGVLWKIPLTSSLNADRPAGYDYNILPGGKGNGGFGFDPRPLPVPLRGNPNWATDLNGYNHFGDLDDHNFGTANVLFVPVQGSNPPLIAIFDADTLNYVTATQLPDVSSTLGVDLSASGAWVAAQPGVYPSDPVKLWVSDSKTLSDSTTPTSFVSFDFDTGHTIVDISGNWAVTPGSAVQMSQLLSNPVKTVAYDGSGFHPVLDMYTMQGGAFNEDGTLLYTSNGYCDSLSRLHVFRIGGGRATLWDESFNHGDLGPQVGADRAFSFDSQLPYPFTGCSGDEPEGLDYFDTRGRNVSADIPISQLHALMGSFEIGDDDVWIKHYKLPDATPQPIPDLNLVNPFFTWGSSQLPGGINPLPDWFPTSAWLAADGNTDGNYYDGSVYHSDYGLNGMGYPAWPGQYWAVDLGAVRTVNAVNIFNRTDCCSERLAPYNVLAWDPNLVDNGNDGWYVISDHTGDTTAGVSEIDIPLPRVQTQYIMIAKTDPDYLHLAEVRVMGH